MLLVSYGGGSAKLAKRVGWGSASGRFDGGFQLSGRVPDTLPATEATAAHCRFSSKLIWNPNSGSAGSYLAT